jgi:thiamine pyrophosphate-dependent acetolactate synthase large subunit-like protein
MDIKCVVFNNSELAKISLEQRNAHYDVWETSLVNPSFADFAKLCGTNAVRLTNPDTLEQDLQNAISQKGACLIEIDIKE